MQHEGIEDNIIRFIERSTISALADRKLHPHLFSGLKVELEIPKERLHGDIATNVAMRAAKNAKLSPLSLAELIAAKMVNDMASSGLGGAIDRIEAKPPGFINFFFTKEYLSKVLLEIRRSKDNFGRSGIGKGAKAQIEFTSANPTGPLTIAHGRQAAIGDSLANILEFLGYKVTREYYLNDEGTQMDILAKSIRARYLELCGVKTEFPQDGYKGLYIADIAGEFKDKHGDRFQKTEELKHFREFGLCTILKTIKKDLARFGVKFDVWYSQRALGRSGKIEKALLALKEKGCIYEKEGALWFGSTKFGDDKDRVVRKSDGSYTYLAPDIAYHRDKYKRGFKKIIDIWGPDHHGYVGRLKAAVESLGFDKRSLDIIIVQLATLYRTGEQVSMSTRAGEFVTLREVMDDLGKDVARFCFIMRRVSSHLDFDLDIVKKQSMENPVYYIQYAHARIWSILEYSKSMKVSSGFNADLLVEPEELELLRVLRQFPAVVGFSGKALEPYIILQYLQDLATVFHSFYTKHRVILYDTKLAAARLALVDSIRIVLANGLRLLGVSLPKKM